MRRQIRICMIMCCVVFFLTGCQDVEKQLKKIDFGAIKETIEFLEYVKDIDFDEVLDQLKPLESVSLDEIPEYSGEPYIIINKNKPDFSQEALVTDSYEWYSILDPLGRCGVAEACIGKDIMPEEERGAIGQVKPAGWHTVKYDNIDGMYLYNRCHLIGYQLTGENANERNLITGTRYMNVEGMLPFENMTAEYIERTGNHVMYRVTPVYDGLNLICRGVRMEAYSVEDQGRGISFHVFVYNVQPGIEIDYATGESKKAE